MEKWLEVEPFANIDLLEEATTVKRGNNRGLTSDLFVVKFRSIAGGFPGETRIGDLRLPSRSMGRADYKTFGYQEKCYPPDGWEYFYRQVLTDGERIILSRVFNQAMISGFDTVRKIRDASRDKLRASRAQGNKNPRISEIGADFFQQSFKQLPYKGKFARAGEWVVFR